MFLSGSWKRCSCCLQIQEGTGTCSSESRNDATEGNPRLNTACSSLTLTFLVIQVSASTVDIYSKYTVYTQMSPAALIFSATVLLRRLFGCGALLSAALNFSVNIWLRRAFGTYIFQSMSNQSPLAFLRQNFFILASVAFWSIKIIPIHDFWLTTTNSMFHCAEQLRKIHILDYHFRILMSAAALFWVRRSFVSASVLLRRLFGCGAHFFSHRPAAALIWVRRSFRCGAYLSMYGKLLNRWNVFGHRKNYIHTSMFRI